MRKKLVFLTCFIAILVALATSSSPVLASSYGLYGTVTYPGGGVVAGATVYVYKSQNGQYVYHGSTTASACGYYTYDTGERGNFRVYVNGTYSLRYAPCGSVFAIESVAGDNFGIVSFSTPQLQLNIPTA